MLDNALPSWGAREWRTPVNLWRPWLDLWPWGPTRELMNGLLSHSSDKPQRPLPLNGRNPWETLGLGQYHRSSRVAGVTCLPATPRWRLVAKLREPRHGGHDLHFTGTLPSWQADLRAAYAKTPTTPALVVRVLSRSSGPCRMDKPSTLEAPLPKRGNRRSLQAWLPTTPRCRWFGYASSCRHRLPRRAVSADLTPGCKSTADAAPCSHALGPGYIGSGPADGPLLPLSAWGCYTLAGGWPAAGWGET